jgi:SAM-dependent methyltransferase
MLLDWMYVAGMDNHDRDLQKAFDGQAARFERAPVQSNPAALARLVAFAALPPGARVLDAGCGPGLVAEALLTAGYRVHGIDLSPEMVRRARERCARFGEAARFDEGSVMMFSSAAPFDAAVSRLVLHHVEDPLAFVRRQAALVRPGGAVVASDHTGDPDPTADAWMQRIERARDRTHVRNLTPGGIADLLVAAGLEGVTLAEERFELDFDEWFDRGTPDSPKPEVRAWVLSGRARGYDPVERADGGVTIRCFRTLARAVKPAA